MHLILGGRYQGKTSYAYKLYTNFPAVYNLENDSPQSIIAPGLIMNIHLGVKKLLAENVSACDFFMSRLDVLKECVITGDEICGGVVPVDGFGRLWRDETGRLYQMLAHEAEIVDRVFAGLALRLKGA
ncbi:MAG: bifunctional adenosylcobinamide kinase/adenosylcobinamide-phosphate guanylyltransferase [Synergistaceae bacterium]|nr:bifunctional adenosylcobinamide kinase/adenosylcobinamide-phosphate guanylyltransferase [Synergistaceae bacterium]